MEKFTKGEWKWLYSKNDDGFFGLYSGDEPVAVPQCCNDGDDGRAWFSTDESYYGETALKQADADLIAAAPEMYEMLKQVSELVDIDGGSAIDWIVENTFDIRELLAKARGEK